MQGYSRDEMNDPSNEIVANHRVNKNKTTTSKSPEYKTNIPDNNTLDIEVAVPLKYLSNFWRYLDPPLINCEIEIDLSWSRNCVIPESPASAANAPQVAKPVTQTTGTKIQINSTKLYVTAGISSRHDKNIFLRNIKHGFKTTIYWSKYRSDVTAQPKNNNLDYMIDPTSRNINSDHIRPSFSDHYIS